MNYITHVKISFIVLINSILTWSQTIPPHLLICYSSNTVIHPMTMTTLVDLIRKFELTPNSLYSPRTLASLLIHRYSVDGVERDPNAVVYTEGLIPFRIAGFQRFRNEILQNKMLPANFYNDENILTVAEMCTLHFMLSSAVDLWERGDEYKVCPKLSQQKQWYSGETLGTKMSSCPIEMGVVWSNDQAISPNRIIAAIFSALQPVNIMINSWSQNTTRQYLTSLWASTFAGDFAELVTMQTEQYRNLGPGGYWNDSLIPTNYFLMTSYKNIAQRNWEFTNSELLGDIDGLMMALEMITWEEKQNMRLSQIIELFYRGELGTNTCKRYQFYQKEIEKRRSLLESQTKYFAKELLQICTTCDYQDENTLEININKFYVTFNNYAKTLIEKPVCPNKPKYSPRIQLNVIFDSTYQPYEKLQFFMVLADKIDVSYYGSRITLINGQTGNVIVNSAATTGDMYQHWVESSDYDKDPKQLDLSMSMSRLNVIERRREYNGSWDTVLKPAFAHATLVLATRSTIQSRDLEIFKSMQRDFLTEFPEQRIFYLCNFLNKDIMATLGGYKRDRHRNFAVIFDPNEPRQQIDNIINDLMSVRRELKPRRCQGIQSISTSTYNEVITPQYKYNYIIEPQFLCNSSSTVNIKIINGNNGEVELCTAREENSQHYDTCRKAALNYQESIILNNICDSIHSDDCKPIFIQVIGDHSLLNCGDGTCRRPDQIQFTLQVDGLQCFSKFPSCNSKTKWLPCNCLLIFLLLFVYISQNVFIYVFI